MTPSSTNGDFVQRQLQDELLRVDRVLRGLERGHSDGSRHDAQAADYGSETLEREWDVSLLAEFESERAEILAALERLEVGRYGLCERCHRPIDANRLVAMPTARFCKPDQEACEAESEFATVSVAPALAQLGDKGEFLLTGDELEGEVETDGNEWDGPEADAVHVRPLPGESWNEG
jgi:RNA polymerase-binding transcription factor DksA